MHLLPALGQALGQANVHEPAKVKKREQHPAKKREQGCRKKLNILRSLKSVLAVA